MPEKRHSKKREAILELIRSTKIHPGAQWVYDRLKPEFPDLSLGTVYRNISIFRQEGLLAFVGVVNGEERFDGTAESHPHVCCTACGVIADLDGTKFQETLTRLPIEIPGFSIDVRNTVFYGICAKCLETTAMGR